MELRAPVEKHLLLAFHILFLAATTSVSQQANGHTDPQDVYALRILYESLRSPALPGWKQNGGDPCGEHWHGVECSGRNVIAVRLPGLRLRGSLGFALNKFTSLLTLDLSNNHIGETLPFQFPSRVVQLNLGNNVFIGSIPYSMKRLLSLTKLNLSTNFLSGDVPDIFEKLSNLQSLDISNNNFTGGLPASFSSLMNLATLHIQQNELNGTLHVLEKLPLKDLNIENNGFTGKLPPAILAIPIFRGSGNQLNGSSPFRSSSNQGTNPSMPLQGPRPHESQRSEDSRFLTGAKLAGIIAGAIITAFVLTFMSFTLAQRTNKFKCVEKVQASTNTKLLLPPPRVPAKETDNENTSSPARPSQMAIADKTSGNVLATAKTLNTPISAATFSFIDLQAATGNFSNHNLIGEGLLGRVYKAELFGGKTFAVKKLESYKDEESLVRIISNVSRLHHGNLVELAGFCVEKGQCFLVYPHFSGSGTLHDLLHLSEKNVPTWNQRMRVSLGAARALEYLHEVASPSTVHRNFKSANILLDEEFNPFLSDTGLAALIPFGAEREISSQMVASFGYSAPEYALAGIYTTKSDVYSFGVVMLELLTGREPLLDRTRSRSKEQSLVAWAIPHLNHIDNLAKIVDPRLEGMYPAKALSRYAEIVSQCVQVEAADRPAMSQVVQSLSGLVQRAGMSKRTLSREMPINMPHSPAQATGSCEAEASSSFEKPVKVQRLSDSIRFTM